MAGRIVARNTDLFAHGQDISGRANAVTITQSGEAPEVTCFGENDRTRLHGGIKDAEVSVEGFWDAAASTIDNNLSTLLNASALYAVFPEAATASKAGYGFSGVLTAYEIGSAVEDATTFSATVAGTYSPSAPMSRMRSLVYRLYSGVGTSTLASVDYSASCGSAVYVHYHLFTLTGMTGTSAPEISASYQESGNDSAWTTMIDYGAAASTSGCARWTALASASRYRRVIITEGGGTTSAPSATLSIFSTA